MYQVGQEIKPNRDVPTGKAPGQETFDYGRLSPTAPGKVIGSRNVNGQLYYNIDQKHIGGGTGWVNASSIDAPSSPTPSPAPGSPAPSSSAAPASAMPRTDYVTQLYSQFLGQDAQRAAASTDARNALTSYYANLEDPVARFNRLRTEQGIPQQQELVDALSRNALDTEKLIEDLEPDVNNRVKNFLIDETGRTSLLAREREPLQKSLTQILRQKEREGVGLDSKQALVSELLNLSFRNDEMKARPLQLNVDFTEADRKVAQSIFSELAGRSISAFDADVSSAEADRRSADRFAEQIYMENLRTQNDINKSMTLKAADKATEAPKKQAESEYQRIMGNSKSEYEIWKKIYDNRDKYAQMGIIDKLWRLHGSFKADLQMKEINKSETSTSSTQKLLNAIKNNKTN